MNNLLRGIVLIALLAFFSCKDDDSLIGDNFIDSSLEIHFETITNVTTQTIAYDQNSLIKSNPTLALLGDYQDEIFGNHKSMLLFNVAPESNTAEFGENPVADTLRLTLMPRLNTFYGFDEGPLTVTVYRLSSSITEIHETPFSEVNINDYYNESDIIGQSTYTPIKTTVDGTKTIHTIEPLEIDLIPELAQEFMELGDSIISTDSLFLSTFHGVLIKAEKPDGSPGLIITFDYKDEKSKLSLKFHNDEDSTLVFNYPISKSENTSLYNFFEHNYTIGTINNSITTIDPLEFKENDSLMYLQSMGGLHMKIRINMANSKIFEDSAIVINKAQLSLTPIYKDIPHADTIYNPQEAIEIRDPVEGDSIPIIDYYSRGYESYNKDKYKYDIQLSRLIFRKIKTSDEEVELWIIPFLEQVKANRAVFYGSGATDPANRPKIIIHYSKRSN